MLSKVDGDQPTEANMIDRSKEIEGLEEQLRLMSQAAADAIERANRLETELQMSRRVQHISASSSCSSISSQLSVTSTPEERLHTLESALDAIHRARSELTAPYNYQYI